MPDRDQNTLRPLWQNRDYLLLWGGQTVSSVGSSVSQLALPLLVLALTGSPAQAGVVGGLASLPYLIFSLPAGALVDRWDRKRVMIRVDLLRAANLLTIPLAYCTGHLGITQLYLVAFIEGSGFVFFNIAETAALPRVVQRKQLPRASAQNMMMYMLASLIGPPIGGTLYQSVGRIFPFVVDSISYACSVLGLLLIRTNFQAERERDVRSLRREMAEGLNWVRGHRVVRDTALLVGFTNLFLSGNTLLLIVLARHLGASPGATGIIMSISALGGVAGALVAPRFQGRFSFGLLFTGLLWLQALLIGPYLVAGNLLVLTVAATVQFIVFPVINVAVMSYRLALIPDELQGRVNSIYRLITFAPGPAGTALMGLSLQYAGPHATLRVMAVGLGAAALLASFNTTIRRAPRIAQ